MKTQKVSFQGARFLPSQTTQKMQTLLLSMNSQTEFKSTEMTFESKILSCLKTKFGNIIDSRFVLKPTPSIGEGRALIEAKNLKLEIKANTGEILSSKKSSVLSWGKVYRRVENLITNLQENLNNEELVEKRFLKLGGLTQKGVDKFKKAIR